MNNREEFEAWYKENNPSVSVQKWANEKNYLSPSTQFAWKVWQAALASQAQQQAQELESIEAHLMDKAHEYWKIANRRHSGAVQWIRNDETGALLVFTRGEYSDSILNSVVDIISPLQSQAQQTELGNQSINKLLKSAESVIEDLLKLIDTPPRRNCSCHIAPPCSDCVDYSYTREVLDQANDFMSSLPPAPEGDKP